MNKEKTIEKYYDLSFLNKCFLEKSCVSELETIIKNQNNFYKTLQPLVTSVNKTAASSISTILEDLTFESYFTEAFKNNISNIFDDLLIGFKIPSIKMDLDSFEHSYYIMAIDVLNQGSWPYFLYIDDKNTKVICSFWTLIQKLLMNIN